MKNNVQSWPIGAPHLEIATAAAWSSTSEAYCIVLHDLTARCRKAAFWAAAHRASLRDAPQQTVLSISAATAVLAAHSTPDPLDKHDFALPLSDGSVLLLSSRDGAVTKLEAPQPCAALASCLHGGSLAFAAAAAAPKNGSALPAELQLYSVPLLTDTSSSSGVVTVPGGARALRGFTAARAWAATVWEDGSVVITATRRKAERAAVDKSRSVMLRCPHLAAPAPCGAANGKRRHSSGGGDGDSAASPLCAVTLSEDAFAALTLQGRLLRYTVFNAVLGTVQADGTLEPPGTTAAGGHLRAAPINADGRVAISIAGAVMHVRMPASDTSLAAALGSLSAGSENPAAQAAQATLAPEMLARLRQPPVPCVLRCRVGGGCDGAAAQASVPPQLFRRCSDEAAAACVDATAADTGRQLAERLQALVDGGDDAVLAAVESHLAKMPSSAVHLTGALAERAAGCLADAARWPALRKLADVTPLRAMQHCPAILHACVAAAELPLFARLLHGADEVHQTDFAAALAALLVPPQDGALRAAAEVHETALRREATRRCDSVKSGVYNAAWRAAAFAAAACDGFSMWQLPLHAAIAVPADDVDVRGTCATLGSVAALRLARFLLCWLLKYVDERSLLPSADGHTCAALCDGTLASAHPLPTWRRTTALWLTPPAHPIMYLLICHPRASMLWTLEVSALHSVSIFFVWVSLSVVRPRCFVAGSSPWLCAGPDVSSCRACAASSHGWKASSPASWPQLRPMRPPWRSWRPHRRLSRAASTAADSLLLSSGC